MDLGVLLVGWDRPEPRVAGHTFARIRVNELDGFGLDGWPVIVLGDQALEVADPETVANLIHKRRVRVMLAPEQCSGRRLVRWLRARFDETILPEQLGTALATQPDIDVRPQPVLSDWLATRPYPRTDASIAISVVPDLARPFSVQEWSSTLRWNRQRLWRVCQSTFGVSPKTLLDRYVDAVVSRGRASGMSLTALARTLGYSDTAALVHSLNRAGRPS